MKVFAWLLLAMLAWDGVLAVMDDEEEEIDLEPVYPDDMDETNWSTEDDIPEYSKLITHDCNTIRKFDVNNLEMEDWINNGRTWTGKKLVNFVKYNHAYGIPILGRAEFTDDSMRRACYLVRYLLAGNEQFRRFTYKSKMYLKGERGGFCCMPNVGNSGLSCPCGNPRRGYLPFPILQIKTAAHEMAHWYIKHVFPKMHAAGYLKLPEFKNTPEWSFKENDGRCEGNKGTNTEGTFTYLWNAVNQARLRGTSKIDACKTHHYFIYSGQDIYLNFVSNGKQKEEVRQKLKEDDPNLYNMLRIIWPCDNYYISVCEDSAHGMTKGLAQKLRIGKSDPNNPTNMICTDDDTAEIALTDVKDITPLPKANVFTDDQTADKHAEKCKKVMRREGWLQGYVDLLDLPVGKVKESLAVSNERGWWLRKCCARTAKFFEHEEDMLRREKYETKINEVREAEEAINAKKDVLNGAKEAKLKVEEEDKPRVFKEYKKAEELRSALNKEVKAAENELNLAKKEATITEEQVVKAQRIAEKAKQKTGSAQAKAATARENAITKAKEVEDAKQFAESAKNIAKAQRKVERLTGESQELAKKSDSLGEAARAAEQEQQAAEDAVQAALDKQSAKNEEVKSKSDVLAGKKAAQDAAIQDEEEKRQILEDTRQAIKDAAISIKTAIEEVKQAEKVKEAVIDEAEDLRKIAAKFY